ncbi:hypothetical protein [Shewanella mangrovisoli]|uniref:hypothetical protein n=1 Tax=Shewanella mangrovisoli TaxID=2864211 RepID=UPI00370D5D29
MKSFNKTFRIGLCLMLFSAVSIANTQNLITSFDGFKWGTNVSEIRNKLGIQEFRISSKKFSMFTNYITYTERQGDIGGFKVARTTFGFPTNCYSSKDCVLEYGVYTLDSNNNNTFNKISSVLVNKYGKPIENHRVESLETFNGIQEIEVVELVFMQSNGSSVTLEKEIAKIDFITTNSYDGLFDSYKKGINYIKVIYSSPEFNLKNFPKQENSRDF